MKFITFFILAFFLSNLKAYTNDDIMKAIADVSYKNRIEPEILYTIVKIESNFDPFVISFITTQKEAKLFKTYETSLAPIKIGKYSLNRSMWIVNIFPKSEDIAKIMIKNLLKLDYSIDVGLGQINSTNFTINEIDKILNPTYNLSKSAKVLRGCFNGKKQNIKHTIECYNYGMRKRNSYPYFQKFIKNYRQDFLKK